MRNVSVVILVIIFALIFNRVRAQDDQNLAGLRKAQSEALGNSKYVITNWERDSDYYSKVFFLYNKAEASIDGAIDFSVNEYTTYVNNKKHQINDDSISAQFQRAISSVNLFNNYVVSKDSLARKHTRGASFLDPDILVSGITATEGIITFISGMVSAKKAQVAAKKAQAIKDFAAKMDTYKLPSWDSMVDK
jgi:hypothetical protein